MIRTRPGRPSLALLTDLYQLTMACGYWRTGMAERRAAFHLFFRRHPFGGRFAIAAGLADAVEMLGELEFLADDLSFLRTLAGADGRPLFDAEFLRRLRTLQLQCDIEAIPEGTVVFAHEPLLRVVGPLWQCQLLETLLLNVINFQTLIATKAARICLAADGQPVLEFGLRRAQGMDGGLSASRAAFIGGCSGTSNVLAAKLHGIPVRGTHAHSWVLAFDSETEAFESYAAALPNNCVFLVDTFDTGEGVRRAIEVGRKLRLQGQRLLGVRLDSGNLLELSRRARQELDRAGFADAQIVASNDLDEHAIIELKAAGAAIDVWGVGTRLATAHDDPALGGVFKLTAMWDESAAAWSPRIKVSQDAVKTTNPGIIQVRRFRHAQRLVGDVLFEESLGFSGSRSCVELTSGAEFQLPSGASYEDLLVPVMRSGELVGPLPTIQESRSKADRDLADLPPHVLDLARGEPYAVGMDRPLHDLKCRLSASAEERWHETH